MTKESKVKTVWHSYRSWRSYYVWIFFVCAWFFLGLLFPPLLILFLIASVGIVIHRYGSQYYITENIVLSIYEYGPGKKKNKIKLEDIDTVEVVRDFWAELFGYGDVEIGEYGDTKVIFKGIRDPEMIAKQLKSRISL